MAMVAMRDPQLVFGDHRDLMISQIHNLVGMSDQRGGIAGDKVLALAYADNERAAEPAAIKTSGKSRNRMANPYVPRS